VLQPESCGVFRDAPVLPTLESFKPATAIPVTISSSAAAMTSGFFIR